MHEVPLLINITLALVVAFFGGVLARRIGLPTIVGYLLAGIVIGPFTPGFVGDMETIQQLAELGVIFLMFGVGLHFSFQDLLARARYRHPRRADPDRAGHPAGVWPEPAVGLDAFPPGLSWACRFRSPARWCCCAG